LAPIEEARAGMLADRLDLEVSFDSNVEECPYQKSLHLRNSNADKPEAGLRRMPTLPERSWNFYFQGHGSEKVVVSDVIAEANRKVLGVPEIRETFVINVVFTLGYTIYLLTAWFKCVISWSKIFPECRNESNEFLRATCDVSCLAFWTSPIAFCVVVVIYFYSDMLCTELYYALLGHNVLIDYDHAPFIKAFPVLILLCWQTLGLGIYIFDRHVFVSRVIRTLPYWIPVLSSFSMLWCTWEVEHRLITLSKYVKQNFEDSLHHLGSCVFVRDFVVKAGVQRLLSRKGFREDAGIGTNIKQIVEEIESLELDGKLDELKPEPHDSDLWISEIIYDPSHQDERSRSFRFWFRIYRFYTLAMVLFLLSLMNSTRWRHQRKGGYLNEQPQSALPMRWLAFEDAILDMIY